MINTYSAQPKKEKPKIQVSEAQKQQYRYWGSQIKRARKARPEKKWEEAEKRYAVKDDRPYVNDCRKQHEATMSFLDQNDASFKVTPAEGWMNDPASQKRAECDAAYLRRVWAEQKCQRAESRKLNDSVLINNGSTLVEFDIKKWMPGLRYLPQKDVLFDPDCGGLKERASWEGYEEDVSIERFRSWHTDMDEKIFKYIVEKAGSVLSETERDKVSEEDIPLYKTVHVVHIFAKNDSAVRDEKKAVKEPDEANVPKKRLAEEIQIETPRRYIQYVQGYPALVVDEDVWQFDLDHDEYPLTHLQMNQLNADLYGFTDHQQMSRLDELGDDMLEDLGWMSFWASCQKFAGSHSQKISDAEIENYLNDHETAFLPDMLDAQGNPKVKPVERGNINPGMIQLYTLVQEQVKEASTLAETLSNADANTFKDVTALAARIADANMHQRINRRLGGPFGYEASIAEDAIKMLEVAHQLVPPFSEVAVMEQVPTGQVDEMGEPVLDGQGLPLTEEQETVKQMPWDQALQAIAQGGQLIKLGADAFVGPELAQFWPYQMPPEQWRLSVRVVVEPGTTRSVTRQQQAATMKQLYVEIFLPFYQMIMQYDPVMGMTFMRDYLEFIGRLAQVPNIENRLPDKSMIQQMVMMMQQMMQQQQMMGAGQQGGGEMNSPEANQGEVQDGEGQTME